ncbi:U-box domain-containing protein 21-like [Punica granatum]|uniref:U-box domain-containing protein n=2 Tax=Punica granatum TaxID=22663 RepID=A0A218VQ65_PUNGR|nr:U-box domain-containing protein 21-like [Punica granatum]OWM62674.1 hypothetical protein CDL15_Pgr019968 [Punica granatum]PKI53459.1 hypothetical protein CRG98_026149 [Punica granatum]
MGFGWRRKSRTAARQTGPGNGHPKGGPELELVIPNHFLCPISLDLMRDPVTVSSGITYDRESIEKWLQGGNFTCPVTNQVLKSFDQIPNHALRKMIQDWSVENRQFGIERVPTPRVPVTPFEVSWMLSGLTESIRSLDQDRCLESVRKISSWGGESDRNRSCIDANGANSVLSAAFDAFADQSVQRSSALQLLEEILSALSWMLPLDVEAHSFLGSPASLSRLVLFSKSGDLSTRRNAVLVLEELSSDPKYARQLGELEGAIEALYKLIEQPICPTVTKSSLGIISNLISSSHSSELEFLEIGLLDTVLELLVDSKGSICERALRVLDELCGSEEGRDKAYDNCLAIPVLVKKLLRGTALTNKYSVSTIWRLVKYEKSDEQGKALVEALQVGAFQKLLLMLQCGCESETKEKATELLKLMNPYRAGLECIESVDFKNIKRSF